MAASKLLSQIDQHIHQQHDFLKTQNSLLLSSCQDFRKTLARIFFLENVAELLKIDMSSQLADAESKMQMDNQKTSDIKDGLLDNNIGASTNLRLIGGTVKQTEVQMLKKLLFRATRGKALVHTFDLNLDISDILTNKSFSFDALEGYVVIFDDTTNMGRSVSRICTSFQSDVFETSIATVAQDLMEARSKKAQDRELIARTRTLVVEYLNVYNPLKDADDVSLVMVHKQFLAKDQIIYRTLNMFKSCKTLLVGLVWVPEKLKDTFFEKREEMSRDKQISFHAVEREVDSELTIPTYFRECEFATVGQMVVEQYEVPAYKEVNPGLFTSISFPFLFGVMFGDVFAGSLLLMAGLYACCAPRSPGSMAATLAPGRHFLLLMGMFSVFCGVIYNDFTSVSMYLFGDSCWEMPAVG